MTLHPSHLEFYTTGPYRQFVVEHRSAGRAPVTVVRAAQPAGDFSDPAVRELTLIRINCASAAVTRDFSAGKWRGTYRNGDFELVPSETATQIYAEGNHDISVFALPIDAIKTALGDQTEDFKGDFGALHARPFRSVELDRLCRLLWNEARADNPLGSIFAEGAQLLIGAELLRLSDSIRKAPSTYKFDKVFLAEVDALIESRIDEDLKLSDLAALAGMSRFQFSRSFKATTGVTPQAYLIERKIARARGLLEEGALPLAEIALACGFASQSHMTDVFRQKLGVTPGRYRREVKG